MAIRFGSQCSHRSPSPRRKPSQFYPDLVRLVSLLPSATEIVYALGLGDELVGVTFECDEPPAARTDKTVVVGGRDTRGMSPGEIDSYVRSQLAAGNDLYTLHAHALAALSPDVILTQDLCRVCALPSGQHRGGAAEQARAVGAAMPGFPIGAIEADGIIVRPGPRLIDGAEAIASILHPDAVPAAPPGRVARVAGVQAS